MEDNTITQADKEYIVRVSGNRFVIPPLCTCCLQRTSGKENVLYSAKITEGNITRTKTISVQMPLCPECEAHRKDFYHKSIFLSFLCVLSGVICSFLAFAGFKSGQNAALYIGAAVTVALYFLINLISKTKPLSEEHSSRLNSVHLGAELMNSRSQFIENIPAVTFTFTNWRYAHLFQQANASIASAVSSADKLNSAGKHSFFRLKESRIGSLLLVLFIFTICAVGVLSIDYKRSFRDFDLRPVFGISTEEMADSETVPGAAGPQKATDKPASQPASAKSETAASVHSASPGARNNPSAAAATKAPAVVAATNGKLFITPDYQTVCPFTIIADSAADYYVYLKYQKAPSSSTASRALRSNASEPYESDVAFYLKAGKQVKIHIPVGVYKLYYATGSNYYGTKLLFGDNTRYYASDDLLSFYSDSQSFHGHTVTLERSYDGNFDTDPIPESQFPIR